MRAAVTGAYGYSGRCITRRLLDGGHTVITLTNSVDRRNPFGEKVQAFPFHFEQTERLEQLLVGADTLINTYWVRFNHRLFTYDRAVTNSRVLFQAAKDAGVRRIVHVSITNPDLQSDLPYFRGKAEVESALTSLGVSYCILRPAILFGREEVLINNIAWSLRHVPMFGVFGAGEYKLQPIYVDDLAAAAVERAANHENEIVNAIGPETFTYRELVEVVRGSLGVKRAVIAIPPALGYWACQAVGLLVRDIVITREEIQGLMQGRLFVDSPALGTTKLTEWIDRHKATLGLRYTSELACRLDRVSEYRSN